MTPQRRLNILLADDGSQHAQAAVELLQDLPLPPKAISWYCALSLQPRSTGSLSSSAPCAGRKTSWLAKGSMWKRKRNSAPPRS